MVITLYLTRNGNRWENCKYLLSDAIVSVQTALARGIEVSILWSKDQRSIFPVGQRFRQEDVRAAAVCDERTDIQSARGTQNEEVTVSASPGKFIIKDQSSKINTFKVNSKFWLNWTEKYQLVLVCSLYHDIRCCNFTVGWPSFQNSILFGLKSSRK